MRLQEKQAAAAARELLKAESSRERSAAAAQARKGPLSSSVRKGPVAAPMRNSTRGAAAARLRKAVGGAAAAPEQMSSGHAAPVPEHNGAGGSGGASPSSFIDGGCFFNGPGSFFAGAGQSSMPQPWMLPQSSDPATWDKNPTPPGGFTNFIQPHLSQNFHFVGGPAQFAPFKPPLTMEDTPTEEELATPHSSTENVRG